MSQGALAISKITTFKHHKIPGWQRKRYFRSTLPTTMKLLSLLLCLFHFQVLAQDGVQFNISVLDTERKPVNNLIVHAVETTSLKVTTARTTSAGKSMLKLLDGKEWAISVGEIKNCIYVTAMPGKVMTTNRSFIYDVKGYRRKKLQNPTRSIAGFKAVEQQVTEASDFKQGECLLGVVVTQPDGKLLPDMKVDVVNVRDSVVYRGTTNQSGKVFFILPNRTNYDIDLDGIINFHYIDMGNEYAVHRQQLIYMPTSVPEKTINDTVYQELPLKTGPTTTRAVMRVEVYGGKKNGIREPVYLRQLNTGKVYAATTNDQAVATFLVPLKHVYMIDFNYQKDVDAINLSRTTEMMSGQIRLQYRPDPRLEYPESFIPTPDRLMLKNFNDFLTKQFERPKNKPFSFRIERMNKINSKSREALFNLTLSGSDTYGKERLPLNAALVLDKSGSMFSDGRSEAMKASLREIGSVLQSTDQVAVILFDDKAVEAQPEGATHQQRLQQLAENYTPSGSTNILDGLQRGAYTLSKSFDPNRSNKIILMTDGYGDNPPQEITDFVQTKFSEGYEFSAIGLGTDVNQSLLELIAMKGNGTFTSVDESSLLSGAFMKELSRSFNYAAKDLVVEIYHNKKLVFSNLFGYPVKSSTDTQITFEVGKVPHETNQIAFLKFALNKPSKEIEAQPLIVKIRYFDLVKKTIVTEEQHVPLLWTEETDTELLLDQQEKELYAIAILNQSLKLMAEAYAGENHAVAKEALKSGRDQIEAIFPKAKPKDVKAVFDEVERFLQLFLQMEKNAAR